MITKKVRLINKYSDKVIDLVNSSDDLTTSDMQGVAMAIVMKLIQEVDDEHCPNCGCEMPPINVCEECEHEVEGGDG